MIAVGFKRGLVSRLKTEPLDAILAEVRRLPPRQAVSPLLSCLSQMEGHVKWHAVTALGLVMARMAEEDMEAARNIMRRLMWSLNDESGGVGWGAAEAMSEIMANHEGLAREYAHILVAALREGLSALKPLPLQRGLVWGIGRLAGERSGLLMERGAHAELPQYLDSKDPEVRGLAARALGILRVETAKERLIALKEDPAEISLYDRGKFETRTVGQLAGEALAFSLTPPERA